MARLALRFAHRGVAMRLLMHGSNHTINWPAAVIEATTATPTIRKPRHADTHSGFLQAHGPASINLWLFTAKVLRLIDSARYPPAARGLAGEWGDAMRKKIRLFLFALLVPVFSLVSTSAVVAAAQQQETRAVKATRWSDPATWPGRKVPRAGDKVTIAKGQAVILDVSPPPLGGVRIDGKLSFSDNADIELTTEWIMVHGELEIGTEATPYTHNATITLTDKVPGEELDGMGDRGIMIAGGTLNLHGDRTNSWTKLADTARAGSATIEVLNASGWRKGDVIVLASTDFDSTQAEERTIAAIAGNVITLDQPLNYMHFGKITFGVDERGEVGLLTRNIRIQASETQNAPTSAGMSWRWPDRGCTSPASS
jgi:hypothetical protein